MILVHAGNRVDGDDAGSPPRFPGSQVDLVRWRMRRLLEELRPAPVISAPAAGADLLLLDEALKLELPVHVLLPLAEDEFRRRSVKDRGEPWLQTFARVLQIARQRPDCAVLASKSQDGPDPFRAGNARLVEHALSCGADVLALAVRPRADDAGSVTDDFVARAQAGGIAVMDIDPGIRREDMRRAFVAMPFGKKRVGRVTVDCDATFRRLLVPALEDADLLWARADRDRDTGLIHVGMLEQLGNAQVVLVDLATSNANVFYELGVRHALADRTTVLLAPSGSRPPFDVEPLRYVPYQLKRGRVDDAAALEAMPRLKDFLEHALSESATRDSPVFEFFELERQVLRSRGTSTQAAQALLELHVDVDAAADRCDAAALADIEAAARAAAIPERDRRQLLLRVAMALREIGHYEDAITVLKGAAYERDEAGFELWTQQLALAYRRRGEQTALEGGNPEKDWKEAQTLLERRLAVVEDDAETCGIAGGLAKRRGMRALEADEKALARAHLVSAAALYRRGVDADPENFYVAVNAVALSRVLAERIMAGATAAELAEYRSGAVELLPVARYFAKRALEDDPQDFWACVTVAELELTSHLLHDTPPAEAIERAYAGAAIMNPRPDDATAVLAQLELLRMVGDPEELLAPLRRLLEPFVPAAPRVADASSAAPAVGP